jgi:small multidrug resistance pump
MLLSWLYLLLAIATEVVGTTSMKLSAGLTRLWPTVGIFVFYGISFVFMALAYRKIDLAVGYAIWSGVGTASIAVIGFVWMGETMSATKVLALALIVVGVVVLQLGGSAH